MEKSLFFSSQSEAQMISCVSMMENRRKISSLVTNHSFLLFLDAIAL